MTRQPAAVVIPADRPGALGIARSLGRRQITVYGIDSDPWAVGILSRYVRPCLIKPGHTKADRLQALVDLGKKLGEKAVLYPISDDDVILCSSNRSVLEKYYEWVGPDHNMIMTLLTKDGLHRAAQSYAIPDPQMFFAKTERGLEDCSSKLRFPVILKPVISPSWLRPEIVDLLRANPLSGPAKVVLCNTQEELLANYRKIAVYDSEMIVQEVIPGEDERLVYFCFYLDRQSKPLAIFAGRKLRLLPVGFGSASFVRSFKDPALEEISLKLLSCCKYQGLGGVEFKIDPRDEQYKLIEFNARYGMWDSLSIRCGVDIPYIAYCDALGKPVEAQVNYREDIAWVDMQRDLRAFIIYRSHQQLTLGSWLRSLKGEKDEAVFSRDDWKPALGSIKELLERPLNKIKSRFTGNSS